jgi:hypothetical protein
MRLSTQTLTLVDILSTNVCKQIWLCRTRIAKCIMSDAHHWLCVIMSRTSLQHVSTAPANTWYHYLLVLLPSKSCFHHGKREVPWLWQVVCSDWTTPDVPQAIIVGQWWWNTPASRDSLSNAATATMAWTP